MQNRLSIHKIYLLVVAFAVLPLVVHAIGDCEFRAQHSPKTIEESRERCTHILSATVENIGTEELASRRARRSGSVRVDTVWQGGVRERYLATEDKCLPPLKAGETYLFFAHVNAYGVLLPCGPTQPLKDASEALAKLGKGWSVANPSASAYPMVDERLKCPSGTSIARYLYGDGSRAYWCEHPLQAKQPLPRIELHPNGKLKATGLMRDTARAGTWSFYDAQENFVERKSYGNDGAEVCVAGAAFTDGEVLVAYTKGETLYPLAIWHKSKLKSAAGFGFEGKREFLVAGETRWIPAQAAPPHRDAHTDECIFPGKVAKGVADFTLVSSVQLDFLVPMPEEAKKTFLRIKDKCVGQGDAAEKPQECVLPKLVAVSDLDKNGRFEFWYRQPYMWDNGMSVAELTADAKSLREIAVDCSDCGD